MTKTLINILKFVIFLVSLIFLTFFRIDARYKTNFFFNHSGMQPAKDIYGQDKGHMGQGREAASSVQAQQVSAKAIAARKTGQYTKNSVRSQFWDLAFMSKMGQRIEIEILFHSVLQPFSRSVMLRKGILSWKNFS